ncbi:hypothetical protein GCM10011504_53660 [Siccirubricoccus deserti]|uniref:Flp family type IVb pilin n=1 Tax=Siccirubricoccus deserti TaxID=2013562 RepID=A0A9X0R3I5_9PROT|nr:Flp family type IVb pilin [Siccirubricoccus deserti]MBC4018886.1 Flp family type IVb pilin [Siccirubricoccus deserti]GGC69001.1 hypothetical protein GCM10011504_53660 [Siccirubricoccus deserti]
MIAHINDQKDALLYRIYVGIERLRPWLTLSSDRRAASAMEYALMAALIGVCVVAAVGTLGSSLSEKFTEIATMLKADAVAPQ